MVKFENTDILIEKADTLFNEGRYNEAIQLYDKVLEILEGDSYYVYAIAPHNRGPGLYYLAQSNEAIQRYVKIYEEAIQFYDKILDIDSNNTRVLINKGAALSNLGKYEQAIQLYNKALEIDPNDVYALNNKGLALSQLGQYADAISYYDKALQIVTDNLSIISNKGLTLVDQGDYSQAIDLAEYYLDENPQNEGLLCVLKNAYEKSNNITIAEYYERKLLEIDPDYECELIQLLSIEKEPFI